MHSQYSDWVMGWTTQISISSRGKGVFSSSEHPHQLWNTHLNTQRIL